MCDTSLKQKKIEKKNRLMSYFHTRSQDEEVMEVITVITEKKHVSFDLWEINCNTQHATYCWKEGMSVNFQQKILIPRHESNDLFQHSHVMFAFVYMYT